MAEASSSESKDVDAHDDADHLAIHEEEAAKAKRATRERTWCDSLTKVMLNL